jgi:hypothetical protein
VRTKHDIQREPSQRLRDQPSRRPLDVSLNLLTPTSAAAITIGIDVTIPHVSSSLAKKSHPSIPQILRTHLASIREKFQGRTTTASSAEDVIQSLNTHHIALIPFTVDHLGGLGSFAISLLFAPQDSPISTALPRTPIDAYNFKHPSATHAFQVASASSLHVAHHANRQWANSQPTSRFGQTYHTMTPQQWSLQSLSLNISHGLSIYLQGAVMALSTAKSRPTSSPRTTFYGPSPYSFRPCASVLTAAEPQSVRTRIFQD